MQICSKLLKHYLEGKIVMNLIKKVIDDWDPIEKNQGNSNNEYGIEINKIEQLLNSTTDLIKLSEGIYEVFIRAFVKDTFKKSKSECKEIAQILLSQKVIKKIINDWDPIDLFPGAPDDEYWTEIEEIEQLFRFTNNPIKLSEAIYKIFVKSFGEDTFKKSESECEQIAQVILSQERM